MGRPPIKAGARGNVSYSLLPTGGYRARKRFRFPDGTLSMMERSAKTKSAAQTVVDEAIDDALEVARTPATEEQPLPEKDTFPLSELLSSWWTTKLLEGELAPSSERSYRDILDRLILPELGDLDVLTMTPVDLKNFLGAEAKTRRTQAKLARTILNQALDHGVELKRLPLNFMPSSRPLQRKKGEPRKRARAMTVHEVNRMRAVLGEMRQQSDLALIFELQLALGSRISETLSLKLTDFYLGHDGRLRVSLRSTLVEDEHGAPRRQEFTKDGLSDAAPQSLPLWAEEPTLRLLERARQNLDGFLFVSRNGTLLRPRNIRASWRNVRDRAGLDWVTPHVLRATAITQVALTDGELAATKFARHKSPQTMRNHYLDLSQQQEVDVAAAMSTYAPGEDTPST